MPQRTRSLVNSQMRILDKTSIALGVEWTLHESITQAKRAVSGKKKILVARKIISGECVQGICEAPQKGGKWQAGALLVAAVANDALVYHSLGDGNAWVCAVREGIPLHGFDIVVDEETAKMTLAEVMSYVPSADIYGDIPGAKGSLEDLFALLTAKDKRSAQLVVPDSLVTVLLLVLGLLGLAGALFFGFLYYQKFSSMANSAALQLKSEEELRKARAEFEAEVAKQREIFWYAASPQAQFALWFDVLHKLPLSVNGWVPSSFSCDVNNCQVGWKRDPLALPSAVGLLPGKGADSSFNPARTETKTTFDLTKLDQIRYGTGPKNIDQYLLDFGPVVPTVIWTMQASRNPITVVPPKDVPGLVPVTLGIEGTWKASTANLAALPALLQKLELPGMVLTSLKIANLPRVMVLQTVELEGRYRVGN